MDRSLGSSFLSNRSSFSPKARPESRRSTFRKSSRISISGKSTQSINQVLTKSQNYCAEIFGQPLPVLVTEALTFSEKNVTVSANVSDNGYAWLVCGRRLLIWQYRQNTNYGTPQRKGTLCNQCIELKLPQSDLAHRAELVSVFISNNSHSPSCIAASPEGVVRFWPSIAQEGFSIEECVDLQGQECDSLTETDGLGCVLATTTSTIVLVQPLLISGRYNMHCKILKTPTGWLGGLGKRMSSLIFGPISSEHSAETRLVRVLKVSISDRSRYVFVLTGDSLQKWKLSMYEPEQLIFVTDLNGIISEGFFDSVWENCTKNQSNTDIWILDLQCDKENIILLVAAAHSGLAPHVHYALVYFDLNANQSISVFKEFRILKMTGFLRDNDTAECLAHRFVVAGSNAYIYNKRSVVVASSQEEPDILQFSSPHDYLLCGCVCVNVPIFFTRNHGFVSVCCNDVDQTLNATALSIGGPSDVANESVTNNLTLYSIDPEEVVSTFTDAIGQLKAAFVFHVQNQHGSSKEIIDEIFPIIESVSKSNASALDKAVLEVCQVLLNDKPTGDPRWRKGNDVGIGSSYSMQIVKQLEDKQKALFLYYKFLKDMGLWNRLSYVVERDTTFCTTYILGEYAEKVVAALTIKNLPSNDVLEKAIDKSLCDDDFDIECGLTSQDIFYNNVTKIHKGLQEIVNHCDEISNSVLNPGEIGNTIFKSNEIILAVLERVLQYRKLNVENYLPKEECLTLFSEYIPWTIANGPEGLYDALVQQQSITYNYGIRNASASTLHNSLYDQLVYQVDIILDGRKNHVDSTRGTDKEEVLVKQYQKDRHNLIKPLVIEKQWERAALLAEKYLDFETLVVLCERTNNEKRLDEYIDRFSSEGFPQFVYSWFLQENKQGELIKKCSAFREGKQAQTLTNFLSDHPTLSWIQSVLNNEYSKAADVLQHLAIQETESLCRQKIMLSLSKLAKLADDEPSEDFIQQVNSHMELIEFQEELPDYVLQQFGYDTIKPTVIPPFKMIHLYTCSEYKDASELEFKKALDLLPYVDQESLDDCKLEIWRRAILRDSWNEKSLEAPLEILQNKLFFKLGELSSMLGSDLQSVLPPIDLLVEDPELQTLYNNKGFQFLLKTAYEHFSQMEF